MAESGKIQGVMVTGATGFVGRNVVGELLARGLTPVCLVRSPERLFAQHADVDSDRLVAVTGDLSDMTALCRAAESSQAVIHLVGIIIERRLKGQTFERVQVQGTRNVVDAARSEGIKRYVQMSALGARDDAVSAYHRTKWTAEQLVVNSGLDWTIFRPSLIHGPGGEFMQLVKRLICDSVPPVIPYFGKGRSRIQPVFVKDVAYCLVESLFRDETVGEAFLLGGAKAYTWVEFYNACRATMPGAKRWKPLVSLPVTAAKVGAVLSAPSMALAELVLPSVGKFRFDRGQVQMSQEDNVCDHTLAERSFGVTMRTFEDELAAYVGRIG